MSELFYQALNQDLYGYQRTRTFSEIYPTVDDFKTAYNNNPFATATNIGESEVEKIYYMLFANYGNSSICSSDEYRFELKLFSLIHQYAPVYVQKKIIQKKIIETPWDGFKKGGKVIYNNALNPNVAPSTDTLTELTYINNQNTNNYLKSDAESMQIKLDLLDDNLESEFLAKFRPLFLKIVNPTVPMWYPEND